MPRQTEFKQETADTICDRIIGGESVRAICADEAMPAASTVFLWLTRYAEFSEQYARAREAQMEAMAEDLLDIADETAHDTIVTESGDRPNSEWITRSRLRVDARKWLMSKLAPKKYGDKLQHTGADGKGPVTVQITGDDASLL